MPSNELLVARIGPDGNLHYSDGTQASKNAIAPGTPPPPPAVDDPDDLRSHFTKEPRNWRQQRAMTTDNKLTTNDLMLGLAKLS